MKLEESEEKINEIVELRVKELHNEGKFDLSQSPEEYEKIIQKLEAEVRSHISVQQQMKLYIESYQSKLEELEPLEDESKLYDTKVKALNKQIKEYESDIDKYKKIIDNKQTEFKMKLTEQEIESNKRVVLLENKIKEMQVILSKYQSLTKQEFSSKNFHKKNEASVEVPENQK